MSIVFLDRPTRSRGFSPTHGFKHKRRFEMAASGGFWQKSALGDQSKGRVRDAGRRDRDSSGQDRNAEEAWRR
jgi:hypothetical protein